MQHIFYFIDESVTLADYDSCFHELYLYCGSTKELCWYLLLLGIYIRHILYQLFALRKLNKTELNCYVAMISHSLALVNIRKRHSHDRATTLQAVYFKDITQSCSSSGIRNLKHSTFIQLRLTETEMSLKGPFRTLVSFPIAIRIQNGKTSQGWWQVDVILQMGLMETSCIWKPWSLTYRDTASTRLTFLNICAN